MIILLNNEEKNIVIHQEERPLWRLSNVLSWRELSVLNMDWCSDNDSNISDDLDLRVPEVHDNGLAWRHY